MGVEEDPHSIQKGENYLYSQKEQPQVFERAQTGHWEGKLLSMKERNKLHDRWTLKRLNTILPRVMERENMDMWVIPCYEHNEDPVFLTMLPSSMMMSGRFTARRRTILIFAKNEDGSVDRLCIVRPNTGIETFYENVWKNPKGSNWSNDSRLYYWTRDNDTSYPPETEYECLARIVKERDPKVIGVNTSRINAYCDGLSHSEYERLMEALEEPYKSRVVTAEKVAVGWLETRLDEEIYAYNGILQINHGLIAEAFSSRVVHPCITTTEDVEWWFVKRFSEMNIVGGAHVNIWRNGVGSLYEDTVIEPGDILHCDISYEYLGLCADVQENGYVLKWDEEDVPEELKILPKTANEFEDIFSKEFVEGRTGNEILRAAKLALKKAGIKCRIFTHPIGNHVHAAGPTIGLTDMQDGVPGNGDFVLHNNTCYSMEFTVIEDIPSWGGEMELGFETNVAFHQGQIYYLAGRHSKFHLIK